MEDDNGRPMVSGPFENDLRVSFSNKDDIGVACIREGENVGIEIERIEARPQEFVATAFTPAEIDLVMHVDGANNSLRDEWLTRAWCAKEAAAKVKEGGLRSDPKNLRIQEVSGERLRIDDVWVNLRREGDYIIAWTGNQ